MLPFALSIFAGAFLLFAVQPVIGKFILPWFGGGPGVWTTCLLFFQTALLGGYAYAHWSSTRLTPRRQVWVHLLLLAAAIATLPIVPSARWQPTGGAEPIGRILLVLTVTVGLPYFVLSATGPLLQHWFGQTEPGRSPYRLYALSNLGSLLALVGYPFVFEPQLSRATQARVWSVGLVGFALGCSWCGLRRWRRSAAATAARDAGSMSAAPGPLDRFLWFALAAIASILLLATTNKLCQDIAAVPFLWILPLALYLISFILCFDHPRWYSRPLFSALFALGALVDVYLLFAGHNARLSQQIAGYSLTLFAACMLCHGEIFQLRPTPAHLTSFYLHISAGGATGGAVVALLAPLLFDRYLELQLGLWLLSYFVAVVAFRQRSLPLGFGVAAGALAATFVLPWLQLSAGSAADRPTYDAALVGFYREHWAFILFLALAFVIGAADRRGLIREWQLRFGNFLMLFCLGLGILLVVQVRRATGDAVATSRDFYGVLKVLEHNPADPDSHYFTLVHGVTSHGLQFANPPKAMWPTTYYTESSGVGLALDYFLHDPRHPSRRIGLVGLGTGTVAAYGGPQDRVRIYELDPQVRRLAETRFSYVTNTRARVDIVLGDARLSLEQERRAGQLQHFDVLALDAFSSDAIPVHLLTKEAFATYVEHLSPDGVIAVHTSNRYLDLQPVVENLARHFGLPSVVVSDEPPAKRWWAFRSTWILLTRNQAFLDSPPIATARADYTPPRHASGLWTDDHASIFSVLKLR